MEYDPLKDRLAALIRLFPALRKIMYALLDLALLRQRYVKSRIEKHFCPRLRFFYHDAGAGFCQYSWFVLRNYPLARVFATDLKDAYLKDFSAFVPDPLKARFSCQAADLQSFLPKRSYDLITAIDILEHIPDDVATLRNFHTSLAPGGILIISTPSDTDEAARFTEEHVRPGYNKAALEQKLADAGFEIRESLYSYGKWGSLAWKLLIRNPLAILHRNKALALLLPFYLLPVWSVSELLMRLDLHTCNHSGTGIIIVAIKQP
jgi:SAM-dependent methyltransferase